MKTRFILNPCSGGNRRRPGLARDIREYLKAQSLDADLVITEGPGHATALAGEAVLTGCEAIIAVGGDGTLNEVAQALIDTPAALGLVPGGSGNGLALHLGMPRSLLGALRLATGLGHRIVAIDTGAVNGRPFFNVMGAGLDADISRRFNRLTRRGLPAYILTGARGFRQRETMRCVIRHGARAETVDALLIAVANSDQYGNNARIAPGARVDDGELDLVVVKPVNIGGAAILAARLFLGSFAASPRVLRLRGARFRIERSSPGLVHTDGETHFAGAHLDVVVKPRSLRLIAPGASRVALAAPSRDRANFVLQLP